MLLNVKSVCYADGDSLCESCICCETHGQQVIGAGRIQRYWLFHLLLSPETIWDFCAVISSCGDTERSEHRHPDTHVSLMTNEGQEAVHSACSSPPSFLESPTTLLSTVVVRFIPPSFLSYAFFLNCDTKQITGLLRDEQPHKALIIF